MPADEWGYVRRVLERARFKGVDSVEEMDRAGLILTRKRAQQIQQETLRRFAEELRNWRPDEILRRVHPGPWTPAEMLTGVHTFLDEYTDAVKRET